jgi:hypothetical protein
MEIHPISNYNLRRLQKYLDYELSTSALVFGSWFWGILLGAALIAAVIFTPLMLKILYEEKKYGWLTTFFIMVILPAIIFYFIDINLMYKSILYFIPIGLFFLYCIMLKWAVRGWVNDYEFLRKSALDN